MTTRTLAVNLHYKAYDVYIGRAGKKQDGYFGNPFRVNRSGDKAHLDGVLQKYRDYFNERIAHDAEFRTRVLALRGKRLGCFCKPGPCHGDVIAEWVDSQPEAT